MSKKSFKVSKSLYLNPIDLASIVDPQDGELAVDANDSNKLKKYSSGSSTWIEVESGGSGIATSAVDTVFTINDSVDSTKQINFDAGGTTSTKTTIAATQTTNRTVSLPDATTTLVGTDTTQTITNKIIVAANNTITTSASGNLSSTEINNALSELQSDINTINTYPNFILNPEFSIGTTGYATYADAAATSPVDGTGGSANITIARSTTTPLSGDASLLLTKDAVNRQGQGFSYDFTIDNASKGKVIQLRFDYQIASGTYANDDISVWIYDVTNARLIQPAPYLIKNSGLIESFLSEFQSSIDSTSYRLIFHIGSTSASAYTIKFDNFYVGRSEKMYGSVTTDWTSYTPTLGLTGTSSVNGRYRRVGDTLEVQGSAVFAGSATGTYLTISLPVGLSIDNSKLPQLSEMYLGTIAGVDNGVAWTGGWIGYNNLTSVFSYGKVGTSYHYQPITPTSPYTIASGDTYTWSFKVPIQGWSSSQQLSQDADTRVITGRIAKNFNQSISHNTATIVTFDNTPLLDRAAMWDSSLHAWIIKTPGDYRVVTRLLWGSNTSGTRFVSIEKNGTNVATMSSTAHPGGEFMLGVDDIITAIAGDVIKVSVYQNSGGSVNIVSTSGNSFSIQRISGPSQIAASETVEATYTQTSAQSIPQASTTMILYSNKLTDTHGAYNTSTGLFTAPISGKYLIVASVGYVPNTTGVRELYINDTSVTPFCIDSTNSALASGIVTQLRCVAEISLLQGQTTSVSSYQNSGASLNLSASAARNRVSIIRVGNY